MRAVRARARAGLTLLEVLVAVAILGLLAAALARQGSQRLHNVALANDREHQMAVAIKEMTKATLELRTAPLDRIPQGSFIRGSLRVTTLLIEPSLYEITMSDSARSVTLLRTSIYRRGVE